MENHEQVLQNFGLTSGETKVYLALMKIGKSTIGDIIKESGVSHSKVYDILDRLGKKGLVGVVLINNRRSFEAKDPERLKEFLANKEKELKESKQVLESYLPELKQIFQNAEEPQEAEILYGLNGIKTFADISMNSLKSGETFYILGAPKESIEKLDAYFLDWHKRRIKKKVQCKMLYSLAAKELAHERAKMKLTEVRFLPDIIKTPVVIDVAGSYVGTMVFGQRPLCFMIKNKEVADNYRDYFELLWKLAKK